MLNVTHRISELSLLRGTDLLALRWLPIFSSTTNPLTG
jgi:hypothetical protein